MQIIKDVRSQCTSFLSSSQSSPNLGSSLLLSGLGAGALGVGGVLNPQNLRLLLCNPTVLNQFVTFANNVSAVSASVFTVCVLYCHVTVQRICTL